MSLTLPFRTPSFTVYGTDDPRAKGVSLAVRVLDEFTQEPVMTSVRVTFAQKLAPTRKFQDSKFEERIPFRNQSGDFCFEGQPNGNYSLLVEPDPVSDYFFLHPDPKQPWLDTFRRDVVLPVKDGPSLLVTMAPKPGYPFPAGTTLLRGRVLAGAGAPVNRASISADYSHPQPTLADPQYAVTLTAETRTDRQGYFALFFRSLSSSPTNVSVTARDAGRVKKQDVQIKERESVGPVKIQFP
jgi:hypothetical protein